VQVVPDHVLVPHHFLARPQACPSNGQWPWKIQIGYVDGVSSLAGQVRCHP
jgi:hypothetical protein